MWQSKNPIYLPEIAYSTTQPFLVKPSQMHGIWIFQSALLEKLRFLKENEQ